jgi:hypothetical protein
VTCERRQLVAAVVACGLAVAWTADVGGADDNTPPPSLADQLLDAYTAVQTVSCDIRKVSQAQGQTVRMLSRIFYERPDRIHVENIAPTHRRIIADGTRLYYYEDGNRNGYAAAIEALPGPWLRKLRNIPGTAVENLLELRGLPGVALEPTAAFPRREGYEARGRYVILACDAQNRLARMDIYADASRTAWVGSLSYSRFVEPVNGCWFPLLHEAELPLPGGERATETSRIGNLAVNAPLAPGLFAPGAYFDGVTFSPRLEDAFGDE